MDTMWPMTLIMGSSKGLSPGNTALWTIIVRELDPLYDRIHDGDYESDNDLVNNP